MNPVGVSWAVVLRCNLVPSVFTFAMSPVPFLLRCSSPQPSIVGSTLSRMARRRELQLLKTIESSSCLYRGLIV